MVLVRPGLAAMPRFAAQPPRASILACDTNTNGRMAEGVTFPSGATQRALAETVLPLPVHALLARRMPFHPLSQHPARLHAHVSQAHAVSPALPVLSMAVCTWQVCRQAGVHPSEVVYVEAHGTGTVAGDAQELAGIEGFYALGGGRTPRDPLLIGSVKSNMGHCEGASGLAGEHPPPLLANTAGVHNARCSERCLMARAGLLKLLLSFEHGVIPGNLHFQEPNPKIKSLRDGTIKVRTCLLLVSSVYNGKKAWIYTTMQVGYCRLRADRCVPNALSVHEIAS